MIESESKLIVIFEINGIEIDCWNLKGDLIGSFEIRDTVKEIKEDDEGYVYEFES